MIHGRRVVVVLPAYNAAATLERTCREIPADVVDDVVLVDDCSTDDTVALARELGIRTAVHEKNLGYGANQKTCYRLALEAGADIVIMIHPDYQYTPRLIPAMAGMVHSGIYDCVLGSRILGGGALRGGMPLWRYVANRFLTLFQNLCTGAKLSEYHSGYRAFSRRLLGRIDLSANSDDFLFDNQMLAQVLWTGHTIAEVSCPTRYQPDSSSIGFGASVRYGLGVVGVALRYRLARMGLSRSAIFPPDPSADSAAD